jgi:hypothetical protein
MHFRPLQIIPRPCLAGSRTAESHPQIVRKNRNSYAQSEASKHQTQYQRTIRRLLDAYVEAQEDRSINGRSNKATRKRAAV